MNEKNLPIVPLVILCLVQFCTMFDNALLANALASLSISFHTTLDKIQLANMIYPLICASIMVIGGFLGIKYGWKKLLIIGLLIISIGEFIAFGSQSFLIFTDVGRVLAGVGGGLCIPALLGYITINFSNKNKAIAFGAIAAIAALGSSIAPIISGFIIVFSTWRIGFLVLGICFLILLALSLKYLAGDKISKENMPFDTIGALLLFIGMTIFLFALSKISTWGFITPIHAPFKVLNMSPSLFMLGIGLLVLFVCVYYESCREKTKTHLSVILPKEFLHNPEIRAGVLMSAFVFFVLGSLNFVLVLYMQVVLEKNAIITGVYLSIFALGMAVTSLFTSAVMQSMSPKQLCRIGIIITIVACFFAIYGINANDVSVWFYVGLFLQGFGCGIVASQASFSVTSAISDDGLASKSSGIQGAARNLGQAIGIALVGLTVMLGLSNSINYQVKDISTVTPKMKHFIEIQPNIPFLSNQQLQKKLNHLGLPDSEKRAITSINESGRLIAIRSSLLIIAIISVLFLLFSAGLISRKLKELKT